MIRRTGVFAWLALLGACSSPAHRPGIDPSAASASLAIRDVTVVDVTDGSLRPEQTVLVRDNRIAWVGHADRAAMPEETPVLDGAGRFLVPGLWDMHVHTFNNNSPQPPNTWSFPLYLANGVTGVRDMWVRPGEQAGLVRTWQRELDAGTFVGPRFGAIGTLVDGKPPVHKSDTVTTVAEARAFVAALAEDGIDFVKPYERLRPDVYHALVEAAHAADIDVAGHGPHALTSFEVSDAGQRSIEHLSGVLATCSTEGQSLRAEGVQAFALPARLVATFDAARCAALYERFVERGTWQVPTLITNRVLAASARIDMLRRDEGLLYMPSAEVSEWGWVGDFLAYSPPEERAAQDALYRLKQRMVGGMHAAGVPLLAGTDVGNPYIYPGFSLLDELAELVEAGLTPLAALQAATLNPARFLGRSNELGTVDVGKLADLVLLEANPLDDVAALRKIHAVVMNGRVFSRADLDRMKQELLAEHYRAALARPPRLGLQPLEPEELQRFAGAYEPIDRGPDGEVAIDDTGLIVRLGDWVERLEPLGGSLFRVAGSHVLYVFHPEADGGVWGFDINDGNRVVGYRRQGNAQPAVDTESAFRPPACGGTTAC